MFESSCFFGFTNIDDYARARELLVRANYTEEGFAQILGTSVRLIRAIDLPQWLYRTATVTPLNTLIRLFLLGVPVSLAAARQALQPMSVEAWVQAGLLAANAEQVQPCVQLQSYRSLIVASDLPHLLPQYRVPNYVMGIAKSSMLLVNTTIRRPARRVLDLGSGCGIQALLLSSTGEWVWATDCNPRATAFARFNASLNGMANLECLTGNLFEPVAGHYFDLIVCNAPYVISPRTRYIFCDSGIRGDLFCRQIIRKVPHLLEENGYFQMICNWGHRTDQSRYEGLAHWFDGLDCDVLVLGGSTESSSSYATTWLRDTEGDDSKHFAEHFEQWVRYYEQEGIEAVSYGVVSLRKRSSATNWICFDDAPEKMIGFCSEFMFRRFQLQDFLQTADEQKLMAERFHRAPELILEQQCCPSQDGWSIAATRLLFLQGLVYQANVDIYVASLVGWCDGQRSLGELLTELSTKLALEPERLLPEVLAIVRQLVGRGFLLPSTLVTTAE